MNPKIMQYRAEILKLAAEHGAHHVRIFGSQVRGTKQKVVISIYSLSLQHRIFSIELG